MLVKAFVVPPLRGPAAACVFQPYSPPEGGTTNHLLPVRAPSSGHRPERSVEPYAVTCAHGACILRRTGFQPVWTGFNPVLRFGCGFVALGQHRQLHDNLRHGAPFPYSPVGCSPCLREGIMRVRIPATTTQGGLRPQPIVGRTSGPSRRTGVRLKWLRAACAHVTTEASTQGSALKSQAQKREQNSRFRPDRAY
jgi:hypothetical protein